MLLACNQEMDIALRTYIVLYIAPMFATPVLFINNSNIINPLVTDATVPISHENFIEGLLHARISTL